MSKIAHVTLPNCDSNCGNCSLSGCACPLGKDRTTRFNRRLSQKAEIARKKHNAKKLYHKTANLPPKKKHKFYAKAHQAERLVH